MDFPVRFRIGKQVEEVVVWITDNGSEVFDSITVLIDGLLNFIMGFMQWVPWPVTIIVFILIGWRVAGKKLAIITGFCLFMLGSFGLWEEGMNTLALVATSVFISILLGVPLGILAARNRITDKILTPILDGMQTIPSFVYLIPAIMFFGIGNVPGVLATVIFALPPMVRLTSLGIQQVPREAVESGLAFGCSEWQLLIKVQLPLSIPSIMAGINQTIMMALSMVVVAAMIGAGGLGGQILYSLQRVELATGVEAGLAILCIAIVLDRIMHGMMISHRKKKHLN